MKARRDDLTSDVPHFNSGRTNKLRNRHLPRQR